MDKLMMMFSYSYMVRAFIAGLVSAILLSCLGTVMVHKRLSMIGDSLAHTSLAGIAMGLAFGVNPIIGAVCACMVGAFSIEAIRKKLGDHSEMAVAVVLSLGVGLAGVMSGFVKSATDFSSFLFGSIVATTDEELYIICAIGLVVIVTYVLLYKSIFLISLDEQSARLLGVHVKTVNFIITLLTALAVSVSARIVGTLIITSLMVVPVASAMRVAKSYKSQVISAIAISVFSTVMGLTLSYLYGLKPGGTICLISVAIFIICIPFGTLKTKFSAR